MGRQPIVRLSPHYFANLEGHYTMLDFSVTEPDFAPIAYLNWAWVLKDNVGVPLSDTYGQEGLAVIAGALTLVELLRFEALTPEPTQPMFLQANTQNENSFVPNFVISALPKRVDMDVEAFVELGEVMLQQVPEQIRMRDSSYESAAVFDILNGDFHGVYPGLPVIGALVGDNNLVYGSTVKDTVWGRMDFSDIHLLAINDIRRVVCSYFDRFTDF